MKKMVSNTMILIKGFIKKVKQQLNSIKKTTDMRRPVVLMIL
ncbi:hypothetical protein FHS86_000990 [Roseimarinus sediminis]